MCWAVEVLSATVIEEVQIALLHVLRWKKASPACSVVWFNAKLRLHGTGKACSGFCTPLFFKGRKRKEMVMSVWVCIDTFQIVGSCTGQFC